MNNHVAVIYIRTTDGGMTGAEGTHPLDPVSCPGHNNPRMPAPDFEYYPYSINLNILIFNLHMQL